jgi:hypothetical protein
MPYPRRNPRRMSVGANPRACTTFVVIWCGGKTESFGACRTCAAAGAEARFDPEPFVWRFPEGPSTKREFEGAGRRAGLKTRGAV